MIAPITAVVEDPNLESRAVDPDPHSECGSRSEKLKNCMKIVITNLIKM